jgi:GWxTD domain-containing protein
MLSRRLRQVVLVVIGAGTVLSGCASRPRVDDARAPAPPRRDDIGGLGDATRVYQKMGLLASAGPVPFVGSVGYLAGATPDTTLALVTLSLANRALTFARVGEVYEATYQVQLDMRQGSTAVRHVEAREPVRVASFRETSRGDESVIFQQVIAVPPGQYTLAYAVRDAGSGRSTTQETTIAVPRLAAGALSSPIAVLEVTPRASTDSLPEIVANPRSTASFGRDTLVPVYLEGYGAGGQSLPVAVDVRGDGGSAVWSDTLSLARRGALFSGVINVPVSKIGVGVTTLVARRGDSSDSARVPVFVTFGDELPVATFDEMLNYLRYYTALARIQALRDAPAAERPAAWSAFLRETDPNPSTPQHEGLRDYFARVRVANERFREEGMPGWTTERGMVLLTLGEPDQVYEQGGTDLNQRGRAQVWEYRTYRVQLVFIDQSGFGRWRMTVGSQADFRSAVARLQGQSQ